MQLSRPTLLAFNEYKGIVYGDKELDATKSYILKIALNDLLPLISSTNSLDNLDLVNEIDWKKIAVSKISGVTDGKDTKTTRMPTTLTLDISVSNALSKIQSDFLVVFDAKRVYINFVVKMIIFGALLKRLGQL